jgi:hypothetical protein
VLAAFLRFLMPDAQLRSWREGGLLPLRPLECWLSGLFLNRADVTAEHQQLPIITNPLLDFQQAASICSMSNSKEPAAPKLPISQRSYSKS